MVIYAIVNLLDGKRYIGQTTRHADTRFKEHRNCLIINTHENPYLQHAWNKYGENSFEFIVLTECNSQVELDSKESELITLYSPKVYNLRTGGSSGVKFSAEMKQKMSIAQKRRCESFERKQYMKDLSIEYWKDNRARCEQGMRAKKSWEDVDKRNSMLQGLLKLSKEEKQQRYSKTYDGFISPTGEIFSPVINLREFCRTHKLERANLMRVNNCKSKSHKGWTKYFKEV